MGYTNSRYTMKLWESHTNKIKYCSSAKIYEHKDKFGKGWTTGSELITGTTVSTLTTFTNMYQIIPSSNMIYLKLL